MTRRFLLIFLALVAVLATACGRYLTTGVAVVNGSMISIEELDAQLDSVYDDPQYAGTLDVNDAEQRLQVGRQLIVQLIQDELIRQEAKRLKLNVTSAEVDRQYQQIAAAQPDALAREEELRGKASVRELIEGQLLQEKLADKVTGDVQPSEQELRAAYGNGQRFEEISVRHILFQVNENVDEATARREAQDALDRLNGGADFATLARQLSDDPGSKDNGGSYGYVTRETNFDETFLNAAFALKEGRISGLVRTQFGFHIIKVDDRRIKTFEQARAELSDEISTAQRTEAYQAYLVDLVRGADITVNPRWGDFDKETFRIEQREFFVPPSPEPETQPVPFQ